MIMTQPASPEDDIVIRLRRIEGQVRGIQRMLEGDRECEEVLTQLMAVRSSIDQVGLLLMERHIEKCLLKDLETDPDQPAEGQGDPPDVDALRVAARRSRRWTSRTE